MFKRLRYDIRAIRERDPAARGTLEILLLYPGLHAVVNHRIAHWFYRRKLLFIARLISQTSRFFTGIEIHPGAKIGWGLFIDHGSGVVIGETSEIGRDCTIYQGVTLGGTGKESGKRHPTLGDNVMVGAGARILGPFKVGDNSKVAAGAVLLQEAPPNSTTVGVPARVVRVNGEKVHQPLDQIHLPDPLSLEICEMQEQIKRLQREIECLKEKNDNEDI